jgi:transcriptional regulator
MSTVRQAMKELLTEEPRSSLELSQLLSCSEKEVLDHLVHLARAPGPGRRFHIIPARCRQCGFVFKKRDRLTRPSRCPLCHHQSISRPRFQLT